MGFVFVSLFVFGFKKWIFFIESCFVLFLNCSFFLSTYLPFWSSSYFGIDLNFHWDHFHSAEGPPLIYLVIKRCWCWNFQLFMSKKVIMSSLFFKIFSLSIAFWVLKIKDVTYCRLASIVTDEKSAIVLTFILRQWYIFFLLLLLRFSHFIVKQFRCDLPWYSFLHASYAWSSLGFFIFIAFMKFHDFQPYFFKYLFLFSPF